MINFENPNVIKSKKKKCKYLITRYNANNEVSSSYLKFTLLMTLYQLFLSPVSGKFYSLPAPTISVCTLKYNTHVKVKINIMYIYIFLRC